MTIYVDVSSALHQKAGLRRYSENLVRALAPLLGDRLGLFQVGLGSTGPLAGLESAAQVGVRYGYRIWRSEVWLRHMAGAGVDRLLPEAELFHATEHLLPPLRHVPTVITVHDLVFERYPEYHKRLNYAYLHSAMPVFCRAATAIIAVSAATRDDLVELYGISADKITVIPEAAAPHFRPAATGQIAEVKARYHLPDRYLLTVGTIEPRKNLDRLLDACGPLLEEGLADALVIAGGKGWLYEGFFQHWEASPWRDRVLFPGYIAEEDLAALYQGAMLTLQPSLYEGFGLPVLEAMAAGSPVCVSAVSSLPEVGGDAACYLDPQSVDSMRQTIRSLLMDEPALLAMRERGLARAATFTWERTARETLAVYEAVLGGVRS